MCNFYFIEIPVKKCHKHFVLTKIEKFPLKPSLIIFYFFFFRLKWFFSKLPKKMPKNNVHHLLYPLISNTFQFIEDDQERSQP